MDSKNVIMTKCCITSVGPKTLFVKWKSKKCSKYFLFLGLNLIPQSILKIYLPPSTSKESYECALYKNFRKRIQSDSVGAPQAGTYWSKWSDCDFHPGQGVTVLIKLIEDVHSIVFFLHKNVRNTILSFC